MLLSSFFLPFVAKLSSSSSRALLISRIFIHHCWENESLSRDIINTLFNVLELSQYTEFHPVLRTVTSMMTIHDSVEAKRVHIVVDAMMQLMANNNKFWRITDLLLEHLIRMSIKSKVFFQHVHTNCAQQLDAMIRWVETHDSPPSYYDRTGISLNKPVAGMSS